MQNQPIVGTAEFALVGAAAVLPILVKLLCYWDYPGSDDAFIHLTIVRNLIEGAGWGINPGEPVNLSSSPLFTGLIALFHVLGLDSLTAGKLLSGVSGFLSILVLHRLLQRLALSPAARVTGVVCAAANFYLWRWNGVAMETMTAVLLLSLACCTLPRPQRQDAGSGSGSYLLAGFLAGLAVLTRFELALILPCFIVQIFLSDRAQFWAAAVKLGLAFAVLPVAWGVLCHFYFGSVLPTTFYAKTSHGLILWNLSVACDLAKLVVSAFGVPLLGIALLAGIRVFRSGARLRAATCVRAADVCLFPLLLAAFYYLKTPALQSSARYYLPALHLIAAVIAIGVHELARSFDARMVRRGIAVALAAHVAVAVFFNQFYVAPVLARFRGNYWATMRNAAEVLKANEKARAGGVLVEVDIGMLSYYAGPDCYFFDGGALASPELMHMDVRQQLVRTNAGVVIETLGDAPAGMAAYVPALRAVWSRSFHSHSLTHPQATFVCNIYENVEKGAAGFAPSADRNILVNRANTL